jgi:hypothetical protein
VTPSFSNFFFDALASPPGAGEIVRYLSGNRWIWLVFHKLYAFMIYKMLVLEMFV